MHFEVLQNTESDKKKCLTVQPREGSKGLMAVGIKTDPGNCPLSFRQKMNADIPIAIGTPNRAIRALFAVAQVLEARFIIT
jgi:hypothetical protein